MSFLYVKELGCWRRYISKNLFEKRIPEFRIFVFCVKHKASIQNITYKYIIINVTSNLMYMDCGLKQALSSVYIRCLEWCSCRKKVWFQHKFWQAFKWREYLVRTGRVAIECKCFSLREATKSQHIKVIRDWKFSLPPESCLYCAQLGGWCVG